MKTVLQISILLLIVSCAPIRVNTDYEKNTDFSAYKTYNYYPDMNTGLSDLDTKRLQDILDETLKARGFELSHHPDFQINIQSSEYQDFQNSNVGVGLGGTGGNVGGGISIGFPMGQPNVNRQIVFDFIDDRSVGLFWQAVSESSYNLKSTPEKREARLRAIVDKVLAKYPPEK